MRILNRMRLQGNGQTPFNLARYLKHNQHVADLGCIDVSFWCGIHHLTCNPFCYIDGHSEALAHRGNGMFQILVLDYNSQQGSCEQTPLRLFGPRVQKHIVYNKVWWHFPTCYGEENGITFLHCLLTFSSVHFVDGVLSIMCALERGVQSINIETLIHTGLSWPCCYVRPAPL